MTLLRQGFGGQALLTLAQVAAWVACHPKLPQGAKDGGAGRDRTDDPLLAKQVLSQLSYGP